MIIVSNNMKKNCLKFMEEFLNFLFLLFVFDSRESSSFFIYNKIIQKNKYLFKKKKKTFLSKSFNELLSSSSPYCKLLINPSHFQYKFFTFFSLISKNNSKISYLFLFTTILSGTKTIAATNKLIPEMIIQTIKIALFY